VPWVLGPVSFASVQTARGVAMPSFEHRAGIAFFDTLMGPLSYAVPGTHHHRAMEGAENETPCFPPLPQLLEIPGGFPHLPQRDGET